LPQSCSLQHFYVVFADARCGFVSWRYDRSYQTRGGGSARGIGGLPGSSGTEGEVINGPEHACEVLVKAVTTMMGTYIRGAYYTKCETFSVW